MFTCNIITVFDFCALVFKNEDGLTNNNNNNTRTKQHPIEVMISIANTYLCTVENLTKKKQPCNNVVHLYFNIEVQLNTQKQKKAVELAGHVQGCIH